jgi:hypothetical protein
MPTLFTHPDDPPDDPPVEEAGGDNEEEASLYTGHDDGLSESETEASVSDYEGKLKDAPLKMFFGPRECRRIFELSGDQGSFVRICGNKDESCKRGHSMLEQAREGYYDTVASRKYVDGKLHTFQSKEERQGKPAKLKAERDEQLVESAKFIVSLGETPLPVPATLKEPLVSSQASPEKQDLPPAPQPEGMGSMAFMMGALTDTLKDLKEEMREIKGQVSGSPGPQANQHDPPQATSSPGPPALKPAMTEPTDWWYAVGKGKDGTSGGVESAPLCARLRV